MKLVISLTLLLLLPSPLAHACTGEGYFQFFALIPYLVLFPLFWALKVAIYALAGEGWQWKELGRAALVPFVAGALIGVVRLPSMPYFTVAMIAIFTIFAMSDLKYFRTKYEGRPPMRVRHALFWGNILFSLLMLGGLMFFSASLQGC